MHLSFGSYLGRKEVRNAPYFRQAPLLLVEVSILGRKEVRILPSFWQLPLLLETAMHLRRDEGKVARE